MRFAGVLVQGSLHLAAKRTLRTVAPTSAETKMPLAPPLTTLPIETRQSGFYQGFNQFVAIGSKVLIGLLIIWAAVFPEQAGAFLSALNSWLLAHFGH